MNRRGFLGALVATASSLLIPEPERRLVYSFGSGRDVYSSYEKNELVRAIDTLMIGCRDWRYRRKAYRDSIIVAAARLEPVILSVEWTSNTYD